MGHICQRPENLFQIGAFHIRADSLIGSRIKVFSRIFLFHPVNYADFRADDKFRLCRVFYIFAHSLGGGDDIGKSRQFRAAFRMNKNFSLRMQLPVPVKYVPG